VCLPNAKEANESWLDRINRRDVAINRRDVAINRRDVAINRRDVSIKPWLSAAPLFRP
jgi:hypothetical protein